MTYGKLGKKAPRLDHRTLKLRDYLVPNPILPEPPAEVSWVRDVTPDFPMDLNDQIGDCVIAAMAHMIQQWTFFATNGSGTVIPTNAQVLTAYEALSGYEPDNPSTDNGVVMLDALQYWKSAGFAGHKILAYMAVDWNNLTEIFQAIQLFGNVFLGVSLPLTVQSTDDWTVALGGTHTDDGAPGSWGGHCVPIMAASPETLTVVTWGQTLKMSHNFLFDYAEEAYVVLSADFFTKLGKTPGVGLDVNQLLADLAAL